MRTIAHLSDPHFGTVDETVREALLRDLHTRPVDLVVLTGDITQRARSWQFRAARAFLDALPQVPKLAIPGNHDIPLFDLLTRFTRPYRLHQRYIADNLEPAYQDAEIAVLCVNATRATRHKNGVLSSTQIKEMAERLSALSQPFRIVAIHQPLAAVVPSDVSNLARGAVQALDEWIPAGADLFLGGHIHLPYCVGVRSNYSERGAIVLQAGTSLSTRIRHGIPNSYNRITFTRANGQREMIVVRVDFDTSSKAFRDERTYDIVERDDGWELRPLAEF